MTKKKRSIQAVSTTLSCALALGCIFVLPGCGGSSGGSSSPTTPATPPTPVRNILVQATFSGLEPFEPTEDVWFDFFTTSTTGTLDITVDWTFASNDVDVLLAQGTLEQALSPACQDLSDDCPLELVAQAATLNKPENLTISGLTAGSFLVIVVNFGPTTESGVVVVGFTAAA
jgi:hypothetical protein